MIAITPQTVISEKSLVAPFTIAKKAAMEENTIATLGKTKAKAPETKSKKATNIPTEPLWEEISSENIAPPTPTVQDCKKIIQPIIKEIMPDAIFKEAPPLVNY